MKGKKRHNPLAALVGADSLGESSDDSDFRIEDHSGESDEEDATIEADSAESVASEDKYDDNQKANANTTVVKETLRETRLQKLEAEKNKFSKILICCICLGDESHDDNEIVECDNCGVTVHEHCYGIPDNDSISSSDSGSSKMPWFCEACRAGRENLSCELCPNFGGIFKETDTGKWVHLVCALYIPGVAFRDVDNLSNVTLFEMSYCKWGERICSLCPDQQFAQAGVCIGCDAGLCRIYFHVTCAQKEGLLAEALPEEINHADPFYAHCKLHSDKDVSKLRKRNWLAFELQMAARKKQYGVEGCSDLPKYNRIKIKLENCQHKYAESKINRAKPWIPTQKMARPLITSASTLRALNRKATLSGIDTLALAMKEAHTNALADVHRKWHISPAFNVEYMGYYLDRNSRISSLKHNLDVQIEENLKLTKEQQELQVLYNQTVKDYHAEVDLNKKLSYIMRIYLEILSKFDLNKKFAKQYEAAGIDSENCSLISVNDKRKLHGLEIDVNVHGEDKKISKIPESLCLKCVTCSFTTDQHLLVKCDICNLYYHLSCLDPPLTRMPKKTRVMGWQCSECDKSSSDSEVELADTDTPRKLREFKGSWRSFTSSVIAYSIPKTEREKKKHDGNMVNLGGGVTDVVPNLEQTTCNKQLNRKKGRKRHQTNSTDSANSEPQKIKEQCTTLKLSKPDSDKSITVETPFVTPLESLAEATESMPSPKLTSINNHDPLKPITKNHKGLESELKICATCKETGTKANIVTCDECLKGFHFLCLNPPVKKSPKARGYSWHCADCDPSDSDSE